MNEQSLATTRRLGQARDWLLPFALGMLVLTGCTSISSQMITRDATNTCWQQETGLQGIPITLKVPTHLKLYVYDKHYLEYVNGVVPDASHAVAQVQTIPLDVPVRDFASEFMYTEKIFTVDFKRPAGGTYNLRLAMTDDQYFQNIQHDVTDQTIKDVTRLLSALLPPGNVLPATAGGTPGVAPNVSEIKSLAAVGVFEIADPSFQQQVLAFLNCHLNKSHDAWVAAPGVDSVNRVGIPPWGNVQTPYPPVPFCPGNACHCNPAADSGPSTDVAPIPSSPASVSQQARATKKSWWPF
jgi:hypothetical protein